MEAAMIDEHKNISVSQPGESLEQFWPHDYFAVRCSFRRHKGHEDFRHICNVWARNEKHAIEIAKDQGLSARERGRIFYAIRISREGYARALRQAGFQVG
jgi:1,2-phenylacetyl-CoA epoxidase PaaB subunit